jgi:hypothetical protein
MCMHVYWACPERVLTVPPQVIELAQQCWAHEPRERPTMAAVCSRLDAILGAVKVRARAERTGTRN